MSPQDILYGHILSVPSLPMAYGLRDSGLPHSLTMTHIFARNGSASLIRRSIISGVYLNGGMRFTLMHRKFSEPAARLSPAPPLPAYSVPRFCLSGGGGEPKSRPHSELLIKTGVFLEEVKTTCVIQGQNAS